MTEKAYSRSVNKDMPLCRPALTPISSRILAIFHLFLTILRQLRLTEQAYTFLRLKLLCGLLVAAEFRHKLLVLVF